MATRAGEGTLLQYPGPRSHRSGWARRSRSSAGCGRTAARVHRAAERRDRASGTGPSRRRGTDSSTRPGGSSSTNGKTSSSTTSGGSALVRMQGAEVSLEEMRVGLVLRAAGALGRTKRRDDENVRQFLAAHGFELRYHRRSILERMLTRRPKNGARATARSCCGRAIGWRCSARRYRSRIRPPRRVGFSQPALRVVLGEPPDAAIVSNEPGVWS